MFAKGAPVSRPVLKKSPARSVSLRPIITRIKLIEAILGGYISLTSAAMYFYPGGTWWDKTTVGHRFWENFLCDLLHHVSLSGKPNLVASRLAVLAMVLLVCAIILAFSLSAEVVPSRKRLGARIGQLGGLGSILLFAPPLLPSDRYPALHGLAVVFGSLPVLVAFTALVGTLLVEPKAPAILRGLSVLLHVALVLSASLYTWDTYFDGPSLKLLPGLERVATILLLLWLMVIARFVRFRLIEALRMLSERAKTGARPA